MAKNKSNVSANPEIAAQKEMQSKEPEYIGSAKILLEQVEKIRSDCVFKTQLPCHDREDQAREYMQSLGRTVEWLKKDLAKVYEKLDALLYPVVQMESSLEFYKNKRTGNGTVTMDELLIITNAMKGSLQEALYKKT